MGGKGGLFFKNRLLSFIFLCFVSSGLMISGLAFAQNKTNSNNKKNNKSTFTLEEVVVTGSRIVRNNNKAVTPIVTVSEKLFNQSADMSIETQLNKLPQFTPTTKNPTFGGDIQPTARNTPGAATISLRGLGANRSLVLINGRRGTPSNAMGVLDINTIPAAAIDYVEAITGGASSTYGADAVSGVVNFILKKNFQGLQLDAQEGVTQEGDNKTYQFSGIMGSNIAQDRGNITMAFSYQRRNSAFQRDRDWYRTVWASPYIAGTQLFPEFSGYRVGVGNLPSVSVLNSEINGANFTTAPKNATIYVDNNGNAFSGFSAFGRPGTSGTNIADGYTYKKLADGLYGRNNTDNYLIFPLTRYNMYTSGNYKLNKYVGLFMQGIFSKTHTDTVQEPGVITSGHDVMINPTIDQAEIPASLMTILNSRPNPTAPFALFADLPFDRESHTDVYTYNMTYGLQGNIPQIDGTWTLYGSHGEAETTVLQTGFASLERLAAIMSQPDFGKGFNSSQPSTYNVGLLPTDPGYVLYSNQGAPNYGFGASTATCTSGINPFDWSSVTQDCWNAILANIRTKQVMKQDIYEADVQGKVVQLPAGEMRAALGGDYRRNAYTFENDTLVTQGRSFIEEALGMQPSGNSSGEITAKEVYGELFVPVVGNLPLVKEFDLELGARRSRYDTTGTTWTYKALADWKTTSWLRFRGGYNRAERSPNIAELYLAPETTFGVAAGGDVCSTGNPQAWSANPQKNKADWQKVVALCGQLMRNSGNATADQFYYGESYEDVISTATQNADGTYTTHNTTGNGAAMAFIFGKAIGNPTVKPEKADTWTAGVVIDSPIKTIPALSDWRVSIDYYKIKIKDAIAQQSPDILMRMCTDPQFNPTYDVNSPYCVNFVRTQTGALGNILMTFTNSGRIETSGLDFQVNWAMDAGPGRVSVNGMINYLFEKKTSELPSLPMVDWAGTFGPTNLGMDGNSYRWRSLTTVSYQWEDLRLSVRWQHLPHIKSAAAATNPETTITGAPAYDMFDVLGNYNLTSNIWLRFGCENIFNTSPPLTGINTAATGFVLPGGAFNGSNYDINGRRFYLGARWFIGS